MTTITSAIPRAMDYLASTAATVYAAYATANSMTIEVFDGPPPAASQGTVQAQVFVGFDPDNAELPVVVGDQEFGPLGARTRNETFEIACCARYWSGDSTNVKAVRDIAFDLLAQFETMLRGSPAVGGPGDTTLGGNVLFSQISGGIDYTQLSGSSGLIGQINFHIACRARLTS
jgi:hypothetical protein